MNAMRINIKHGYIVVDEEGRAELSFSWTPAKHLARKRLAQYEVKDLTIDVDVDEPTHDYRGWKGQPRIDEDALAQAFIDAMPKDPSDQHGEYTDLDWPGDTGSSRCYIVTDHRRGYMRLHVEYSTLFPTGLDVDNQERAFRAMQRCAQHYGGDLAVKDCWNIDEGKASFRDENPWLAAQARGNLQVPVRTNEA